MHDQTATLTAGSPDILVDEGLAGLFSDSLSMDTSLLDLWAAGHQLVFGYRVMFYVVRAYQDPVYQMLRICEGADPRKGSMSELLEAGEHDPPRRKTAVARAVCRSLESGCPDYRLGSSDGRTHGIVSRRVCGRRTRTWTLGLHQIRQR